MQKVLISIPEDLAARMKATIPVRQRSSTISRLLEEEIQKREQALYECAVAVENDEILQNEMQDWDETLEDGLDDESW